MKPQTIKIIYWTLTSLFCLASAADAFGGLTKQKAGVDGMNHLGYPLYLMTMLSVFKVLGVIALIQNKFITLKEWAFAGFAFSFIGAFYSRAAVGDGIGLLLPPLIVMAVLFILYIFWKKYLDLKAGR